MNSKIVSEPTGEQMTLFSPVGSLNYASHTPLQENDLEKKMTATSGRKCLDVFEKFNRNGLWAKTFSALLIGHVGWFSTKCNLTWKLKATKYKRMYFQLVPSTPRTGGIGSGLLLKTPTMMDGVISSGKVNPVSGNSGTLAQEIMSQYPPTMAKLGLLPTPRANKISGTDMEDFTPSLPGLMNKGLLPTPQAIDEKREGGNGSDLNRELGVIGRQLNPQFVGEMMGFPPDWTELPFLNGETNQSKPTETP